ncbi:MAG: isoaspartyl peptidase/L-asparaginase family protein [Gammaproteobacteria bacterium]
MKQYSLMIHGGAGELDKLHAPADAMRYLRSIRRIMERGQAILERGGPALDAVETCVTMLENDPQFNAGRGSVLNEQGLVFMDAAIMDGSNLGAGAVADINRIVNPIKLARLVLAGGKHVMLTGPGALRFGREYGIRVVPGDYHITDERRDEYGKLRALSQSKAGKSSASRHGTVGAVARDRNGNLAAGTSTGGMACKKEGRIGDSPIIGAGIYADNRTCAVSATGHGEKFMRTVLAKHIADLIAFRKLDAETAAKYAISYLQRTVNGRGGVIVIDKKGRCAVRFNTRTMVHGRLDRDGSIYCAF